MKAILRTKHILTAVIAAILLTVLPGCVNDKEEPLWSLEPGDSLPPFEVTTLTGEKVSSSDSYLSPMVIIFFNTTCPDCREELPLLQKEYEENLRLPEEKQSRYICISREENAADVAAYWNEQHLTMPVSAQEDRTVYSLFASSGIPRFYGASNGVITYQSQTLPQ